MCVGRLKWACRKKRPDAESAKYLCHLHHKPECEWRKNLGPESFDFWMTWFCIRFDRERNRLKWFSYFFWVRFAKGPKVRCLERLYRSKMQWVGKYSIWHLWFASREQNMLKFTTSMTWVMPVVTCNVTNELAVLRSLQWSKSVSLISQFVHNG